MKFDAFTFSKLIQQVNKLKKSESHIYGELAKQMEQDHSTNFVNLEPMYHLNQQIFYSALRAWYELDAIDPEENNWSSTEISYFLKLQSYLRKLIKICKLLPRVTHVFWQHSLGKCPEKDLRLQLNSLYPPYVEAHLQAFEDLKSLKYSE